MRRLSTSVVPVVAALAASLLAGPAPVAQASPVPTAPSVSTVSTVSTGRVAPVLAAARAALQGAGDRIGSGRPATAESRTTARRHRHPHRHPAPAGRAADVSLALRRLFVALPRLDDEDRRAARTLLARPTDGARDPLGNGYRVPARRRCHGPICIHWVSSTRDAPPSRRWVDHTRRTVERVWHTEVDDLGYRPPRGDGRRGGDHRLDVYLADLGSRGIYGYCVPERRSKRHVWLASGYCVLDNDFARSQYGGRPRASLRVTAAHEFFHAVQFSYDYGEDPWLMESTATWMEERVADGVDDNRQYLPFGQLGRPRHPLDRFVEGGFGQYGNWPFFEFLSSRYGVGVVRRVWERAGDYPGGGHDYSLTALDAVLARHGGLAGVFGRYAAAGAAPRFSYAEGASWPQPAAAAAWRLSARRPTAARRLSLDHLTYRQVVARPAAGLHGRWRVRVEVDGPPQRTAPAAYLLLRGRGGLRQRRLALDASGDGRASVPFTPSRVRAVQVVLVDASTRYSCWHMTSWACQGRARDDREPFVVRVAAVPGRRAHRR